MLSFVGRGILRLLGWTVVGEESPTMRAVIVAAPHTSNWDFIYFILAAWSLKAPVRWMGKKEMFPLPVRWLFKRMGGIPINRGAAGGVVSQMVTAFESGDPMAVVITPEATRKRVEYWKSGFYRIATEADVPVVFGTINSKLKEVGIKPGFDPSGDVKADMDIIRAFYADAHGLKPDQFGPVQLRSEDGSVTKT